MMKTTCLIGVAVSKAVASTASGSGSGRGGDPAWGRERAPRRGGARSGRRRVELVGSLRPDLARQASQVLQPAEHVEPARGPRPARGGRGGEARGQERP